MTKDAKELWETKGVPFDADSGEFRVDAPGYTLVGGLSDDGALDLQWKMRGLNVLIGVAGTEVWSLPPERS